MKKNFLSVAIATALGIGSTATMAVEVGNPNGQVVSNQNNPQLVISVEGMAAVQDTNLYSQAGPLSFLSAK